MYSEKRLSNLVYCRGRYLVWPKIYLQIHLILQEDRAVLNFSYENITKTKLAILCFMINKTVNVIFSPTLLCLWSALRIQIMLQIGVE